MEFAYFNFIFFKNQKAQRANILYTGVFEGAESESDLKTGKFPKKEKKFPSGGLELASFFSRKYAP